MKTHRFDPISFITGLVITLLGLAFLVPQTPLDVVEVITGLGAWFWPTILIVIGIAVLVPVFLPKQKDEESAVSSPQT